ncbi:uncharacterized protein [Spinacia oleracea]|uniref:DUF4218 domain-containing protein n=1 Tax=Spinacia oleracea TaxID=3562 RepID=A0ABM3QR13_SPIOL|nr:uncharacterized protein LOC130461668 [Spinacia oleracea]
MLFCTIQDYPTYGNLSGYTVKGECACPICEDSLKGKWLSASRKYVYFDHRPFLPPDHQYRKLKKAFNGEQNFESCPKVFTSQEVFDKVKDIKITFGKLKKSKDAHPKQGYKKCSGFWRLPYWRFLFVRHSLNVMHIEKNVFDSLIGTLLNIDKKTKDGPKARDDLKKWNIRNELHVVEETGKRKYIPPAAYTLYKKEKVELCSTLAGVKVPEGYSSNISSLVSMENLKLVGLKSHDCHVLMEDFLPIAIRSILPKNVRYTIIRLCCFFKAIYSKVINPKELDSLEVEIAVILCQLEMYFPPSFFDVMMHLPIHLIREIRFCGPVHMRAQWAFERQMKTYKGCVKNAYRPEACIAEKMFYELAMEYCLEHIDHVKTLGLPTSRHSGRFDGMGTIGRRDHDMSLDKWHMAHTYILFNEDEVAPYVNRHMSFLKAQNRKANPKALATEHSKSFRFWFKDQVMKEQPVSERLRSLCYGPDFRASFFSAYVVNGCTFYMRDQDDKSSMQNSGVSLEVEAMYFSSSKDNRPVYSKMQYYGVIDEICELHYMGFSIAVFGCKWADNNNNVICDGLGKISMNLNKLGSEDDPYILASQAKQVFYMTDPLDKTRSVVITTKPRYAIDDHDDNIVSKERSSTSEVANVNDSTDDTSTYVRSDHEEGIWLMARKKKRASSPRDEEALIECENRRGRTVLKLVGNAIRKGIKLPLEWNRNKVPVGDNKDYFRLSHWCCCS